MGILEKLLGSKTTTITSASIRSEIDRCNGEINDIHAKIEGAMDGLAAMTDEQHVAAEANAASLRRSVARLESRIAALDTELPAVLAAEEAQARADADAALLKRANAARKSNTAEAKKLLEQYESAAHAVVEVLTKLKAIDAEREAVNKALKLNPVCEGVEDYNTIHRSTPGTDATERKAVRPCWVYKYPGSPPNSEKLPFQYEAPREEVREATIGDDGKVIPVGPVLHNYYGREIVITPTLVDRDVVVGRTYARPRSYAATLDDVRLPPAFTGSYIWPRG